MSAQVDEATVRQFIEIISAHAAQVINGAGSDRRSPTVPHQSAR